MAFPLPIDPEFRKEIIRDWIEDVHDRLEEGLPDAEFSWKIAHALYLGLPAGEGDEEIEKNLLLTRVKLDQTD